ncbi:hypothetical protein PC116_g15524 [Phytophthora cactorum]|uniref:Uncharacterized protein n=1 Tax=Phytophthora cactorum TaxID=29920 RepID=A0A8T1CZ65_9STRA|nr:hypothetical protein PC114_g18558 [Phytophthora cactorum]KAG2929294.1 hypothetical protein PC117_g14042 [Phytophthora cactorum]KAG2998884.1 hypothetical protein PC119_g17343 [Phytophthora cactorum]KAG3005334.1 hypothetical protein PC120_g18026 [Phytophthora cactorum]KAG3154052.1 hypothetical protein C6341_g15751 [Phytophthora cactorum]
MVEPPILNSNGARALMDTRRRRYVFPASKWNRLSGWSSEQLAPREAAAVQLKRPQLLMRINSQIGGTPGSWW